MSQNRSVRPTVSERSSSVRLEGRRVKQSSESQSDLLASMNGNSKDNEVRLLGKWWRHSMNCEFERTDVDSCFSNGKEG